MKPHLNSFKDKTDYNYNYSVSSFYLLFSLFLFVQLSGCATHKRNALPEQYADSAEISGMPGVRDWGDTHSEMFQEDFVLSIKQGINAKHEDNTINILTISAGGADSAFAAGFINGWDAAGTRPTFKIVTGVSAGSLVAPFAFLGGEYDERIGELTTSIVTDNIFTMRTKLSILLGADSVGDSSPLADLIARYIDEDMLMDIAKAHAEGRRLYLGTTNLDARRLVIWNMGAIANSGHPNALELFRKIMRASASIPIILEPILFEVEADGKTYDEMHADGGATDQIFFYGDLIDIEEAYKAVGIMQTPKERLFILDKTLVQMHYEPAELTLISIGQKTISSMLKAQAIGDLYVVYVATTQKGIDYNLASVPYKWDPDPQELFDPDDMKRLYDLGYNLAKSGYAWQKYPPYYHDIQ